jgi:pilin isopeptide linkage protein/LPXTG-motif cell wall-anchored protein
MIKQMEKSTRRGAANRGLGLVAAALGLCLALLGAATPALAANAVTAEVPLAYAVKGDSASSDTEATFKITATDEGETLLPVAETVTSKPGTLKFELKGRVSQPGEHHYHVTQVAGTDSSWTYDSAEFDVTVYVGWQGGVAGSTLNQIQVSYTDGEGSTVKGPTFTNTYTKAAEGEKNTPAKAATASGTTTKGGSSVVKTGDSTQPLWIGLGAAGAVIVAAGIWLHYRRRDGREF